MLRLHVYKYMFCGFIVTKDVVDVEMIHGIYIPNVQQIMKHYKK